MSKKDYTTVNYVSQCLRASIQKHLESKVNNEFPVKLQIGHNVGTIKYEISGYKVSINIAKKQSSSTNRFIMDEEIVTNTGNRVPFPTIELKPKRSKGGRISDDYLKWFAQARMDSLKTLMR